MRLPKRGSLEKENKMRVKVIGGDSHLLERNMQAWLEENPRIKIQLVAQSESLGCVTVTIFYEEGPIPRTVSIRERDDH
jgi:hypothetical protein